MWYTLDGKTPVPVDDIMTAARDSLRRQVGRTQVGRALISTVFLLVDHQHGEGPPILFETMVFNGPLDQSQERYSTWEQAEAGHARWVAKVQEAQNDPETDKAPGTER